MSPEHWVVKTPTGEKCGYIKRLLIHSITKQITYADVILSATGQLARIPWEHLNVQGEQIMLSMPDDDVHAAAM